MTTEQRKAYIAKQAAQAAASAGTHRKLTEQESQTLRLQAQDRRSSNQFFGAADEESF